MVEQVEDFETERQLRSFREVEALREGRVHIADARQADRVAAETAPLAIRRTNKGRLIDQHGAARSGIGVADKIGELAAVAPMFRPNRFPLEVMLTGMPDWYRITPLSSHALKTCRSTG